MLYQQDTVSYLNHYCTSSKVTLLYSLMYVHWWEVHLIIIIMNLITLSGCWDGAPRRAGVS